MMSLMRLGRACQRSSITGNSESGEKRLLRPSAAKPSMVEEFPVRTAPRFLFTSYRRADLAQHCQDTSAAGTMMVSTVELSQWNSGEASRSCWFSAALRGQFSRPGSRVSGEGSQTQYPPWLTLGEEWWRALCIIYADIQDNGQK